MSKRLVIFDCDGGSDDAWALLLLITAIEKHPDQLELLAITVCGSGNTTLENAARNMWRILKVMNRLDIPMYYGASKSLVPFDDAVERDKFHGEDGFGDVVPKETDFDAKRSVESEHAVVTIQNLCQTHPGLITLIAVGPLTNLALLFTMYGDSCAENIRDIFIMGGNYMGVGNFTRAAEFNFYVDPEAAHIVLTKAKCLISILPWEPCAEDSFWIPTKWRLEEFGREVTSLVHPAVRLLNTVETAQFKFETWNPCDALLVAAFLFGSEFVQKESSWHAVVDLHGRHTRGQMVLDHLNETDKYPKNVRIYERVNAEFFKRIVHWVTGAEDLELLL